MEAVKMYANLHLHSTHSDGVYTPTELVKIAKAEGYKALAITDHDAATAFPEMKQYLADMGERQTDNTRKCFELAVSKGDIGGSDHSGLCGGFYSSCPEGMNIRYYRKYLEPCSVGVEERFFRELKNRKLDR